MPCIFNTIWAIIADPKYVLENTTREIITIFQLIFFNCGILFPTDIPAKASIGIVVPRNPTFSVYSRKKPAVGINGILRIRAIIVAHANAGFAVK